MSGRPLVISVRTDDPERARATCGEHLYPRTMRVLESDAAVDARISFLHLRSVTVADLRYGTAVSGSTGDLGCYQVSVPLSGRFWGSQSGRPTNGSPGRATVYRPYGRTELYYATADCHLLALKVHEEALEATLGALLGRPVRETIRLSGQVNAADPAGRTCVGLVRLLAAEIGNPGSLVAQPSVAAPLEEALLTSLLLAADHQYRDELQRSAPWQHAVRTLLPVVEVIHEEPLRAFTVATLAGLAGMSTRQLRVEFQRQFGASPMAYVRDVRLLRAHGELRQADPGETSVGAVARRWGFPRFDRFAARYEEQFHVTPAATLRGSG